jgi:hypothetical protein
VRVIANKTADETAEKAIKNKLSIDNINTANSPGLIITHVLARFPIVITIN